MTAIGAAVSVDLVHRFRCMAVDVTVQLVRPVGDPQLAAHRAEDVFRRVEEACTRFDPTSALMRANAAAEGWFPVPAECYLALVEAARAHRRTQGRFDPRVLRELTALGYDRSLPFGAGPLDLGLQAGGAGNHRTLRIRPPWRPGFDPAARAVRIGPVPIDLGGIGKGLAVRWAAEALHGQSEAYLVEAGGDLITGGAGPTRDGWRASVEDPRGGPDPIAVLDVTDRGCATSSIRLRSWRVNGRRVHHLIDPSTGEPGGDGLLSVTVLDPDPATAEVWSKTLFLAGRTGIAREAETLGIAALWVADDGTVGASPALDPALLWRAHDGG